MLEFILVLSALTMFVSFIAVIRPIKSLRLPTRKRALGVLLLSCLISEEAWKDYEGQCMNGRAPWSTWTQGCLEASGSA